MGAHSLGYLRLTTVDLEAWRTFGDEFLGLMPVAGLNADALHFRMDLYPPRFVVNPGSTDNMDAMGFEVLNERELKRIVFDLERGGHGVLEGTSDECAERRVRGFVKCDDPSGNSIELFYGPILDHVPLRTATSTTFITGDMGMGHVIVTVNDADAAFDFYTRILGFVERNSSRTKEGEAVWFLGCNQRHHTLGIVPQPGPGQLLHFMVEASSLDDVGFAIDRADKLSIPMMFTLGKHTNDHMVSFYVYSPEGYAVEYGWNGLRIPHEEPTYEITTGAFWGHRYSPQPEI